DCDARCNFPGRAAARAADNGNLGAPRRALCCASRPYGQQSVLFMKKSVGILSGLAVVIAVATTAGAWYTGTHLPAELERSVARGNEQLQKTMAGTGGSMTLELASLEQRFFTSTAHYRLKAKDVWL